MKENEEKAGNTSEQKSKIRERYKGIDQDLLDVIPAIPMDDFYSKSSIKRVAVYARVSTDDPRQTSSYELQKNHYTDMVSRREDWRLVEIYADEGISGTSLKHRDSFVRMINDCNAGKIDLIVTKSVSRFARNILDCIGYVRRLKQLNPPIGIFFETENIYTLDPNSEMSLSFIATLAQEESHTKSEIMNASIEMRFKRGIFLTPTLLGYDHDEDGNLIINEEEAKIVRLIFFMYLYGYTCQQIADTLTKLGCQTKKGNTIWSAGSILGVLQNERHCGDVIARKTFTPNYLDHKSKKNRQDRNQYVWKDHHESIISRGDFIAVQRLITNAKYGNKGILPQLEVVTEGVLKGFVPINPRWAGFKPNDYHIASQSVAAEPHQTEDTSTPQGNIALHGFEVARAQFFDMTDRIFISITQKSVQFSIEAVRRLANCEYVEFLVHPGRMLFAVRSCKADYRNANKWIKMKEEKWIPRKIPGSAYLKTLYELLGWDINCRYRIIGMCHQNQNESILIFNLRETEVFIPAASLDAATNDDSSDRLPDDVSHFTSGSKKEVLAYPADWGDGFGATYFTHAQAQGIRAFSDPNWDASMESQPYTEPDIQVTEANVICTEIHSIMNELKETTTNE